MSRSMLGILMLALALPLQAQYRQQSSTGSLGGVVLDPTFQMNYVKPLLDPSRMQFHQTISAGYSSSQYGSASSTTWMGQLDYAIRSNLDLRLHMGINRLLHNSTPWGETGNQLVGGAELTWNPSPDMQIGVAAYHGMVPGSWYRSSLWNKYPSQR